MPGRSRRGLHNIPVCRNSLTTKLDRRSNGISSVSSSELSDLNTFSLKEGAAVATVAARPTRLTGASSSARPPFSFVVIPSLLLMMTPPVLDGTAAAAVSTAVVLAPRSPLPLLRMEDPCQHAWGPFTLHRAEADKTHVTKRHATNTAGGCCACGEIRLKRHTTDPAVKAAAQKDSRYTIPTQL